MQKSTKAKLLFVAVVVGVFGIFLLLRGGGVTSSQPYVESVFPPQVPPGSVVVVSGRDFSPNKEENKVSLGKLELPVAEGGEYHLVVMVPENAKTGMLVVTTRGVASNPVSLEIFGSDSENPHAMKGSDANAEEGKEHSGMSGAMPHMFFDGNDAKPAPDFKLPDNSGKMHTLSEFKGNFVVLNFWASWCEPCVAEVPSLLNMARHYANSNLKVVAVSIDKSWEDAQKVISPSSSNILVLLDPKDEVAPSYGTQKIPETYIINPEGKIVAKFIGSRKWDSQLFIRYFGQLMQQPTPSEQNDPHEETAPAKIKQDPPPKTKK